MKKITIIVGLTFAFGVCFAQINLGGLKDKLKDKTDNAVADKLKSKAKSQLNESLDKSRKDFDESNFNYAISFIDNSGTFENDEKGSSVGNSISNARKFSEGSDVSAEDKAYMNNHNGELFMATNKFRMAESSFKQAKYFYESNGTKSGLNYSQVISNLSLLYQSSGRYSKAKPFSEQALDLRKDLNPKTMYAVSLNNKGVLLKDLGEYTQAEKSFNEALVILKEGKDE